MKKTSKLLSVFLAAIMLLGVMPYMSSAADTAIIDTVTITSVVAPVAGANATFAAHTADDSYWNMITWVELDNIPMSISDVVNYGDNYYVWDSTLKFQRNKYYAAFIDVTARDGYAFSPEFTATVNSDDATFTWYDYEEQIAVVYVYYLSYDGVATPITPPAPTYVNTVAITDVVEPIIGEKANFDSNTLGDNFNRKGMQWFELDREPTDFYDILDADNGRVMDKDMQFKADKYYAAAVSVYPDYGYALSKELTATVNGNNETFIEYWSGGAYIYYVFNPTEKAQTPTLDYIYIETAPATLEYRYKADVSLDGLKVWAVYSDESKVDITADANVTGFNTTERGNRTATVEYDGATATFNYNVKFTWWQWIIYIVLFGWIWY